MKNNKDDHLMKHGTRSRHIKRRLRPSVVRDPNGSISTFRQFYQSGGRDYEQYRRWLETLSKSEELLTSSVDSDKIKNEPIDRESNTVTILPFSPPSIHSQQHLPMPKTTTSTHSFLKPMQHWSIPINSQQSFPLYTISPSPVITSLFKPQIRLPYNHSHFPVVRLPSSSSLDDWSVTDVGRFIEKHLPEKNIARKFIQQKIDGHALQLLTEDHLTRIFKMKLGPALHLLSLISNIQK